VVGALGRGMSIGSPREQRLYPVWWHLAPAPKPNPPAVAKDEEEKGLVALRR